MCLVAYSILDVPSIVIPYIEVRSDAAEAVQDARETLVALSQ